MYTSARARSRQRQARHQAQGPPRPHYLSRGTAAERHLASIISANEGYHHSGRVRTHPWTMPLKPKPARSKPAGMDVPDGGGERSRNQNINDEPLFECIICFMPIKLATVTSCGHMFCAGCIGRWRQERNSCPTCHTTLKGRLCRVYQVDAVMEEQAAKSKSPTTDDVSTETIGIYDPTPSSSETAEQEEPSESEAVESKIVDIGRMSRKSLELIKDLMDELVDSPLPLRKSELLDGIRLTRELIDDVIDPK